MAHGTERLRRRLHGLAELSGREERTAEALCDFLGDHSPDLLLTGLGGYGLAALYEGEAPGPRVMMRCDMDAVPGADGSPEHLCGHDGHMAMVSSLAPLLRRERPAAGSVVLLYQPSEETGQGASAVLADPDFERVRPDLVFGLHNIPGRPLGEVMSRAGTFASTARSLALHLSGRTSHASAPELGVSPAAALSAILAAWPAVPRSVVGPSEMALVTVVHARLGEVALGTTPGEATVIATLRARDESVMRLLSERCLSVGMGIASAHGLRVEHEWLEEFPCTVNDPDAVASVERAAAAAGLRYRRMEAPFDWTEDFGRLTAVLPGAMAGLGAGAGCPPVHHAGYVFPDGLLEQGHRFLAALLGETLGGRSGDP